jgi:hypothetical protein
VYFAIDHTELELEESTEQKSEIQAERVQKKYDCPQTPSCMDTNLDIGSRQGPVQQTTPSLSFVHLYILIMILACALSL